MSTPVALQLYSIRDYTSVDFYKALQSVKEMGYDGIELAGLYNHPPADIKKMVNEIGLVPVSAHVSIKDLMQNLDGTLSKYAKIGCPYIAIPALPEEMRPGYPGFASTLDEIAKIGKAAKDRGIQLLYHNHDFEFVLVDGVYGLDILYDKTPADLLQTQIDTCWVKVAGEDPAAYVRKYTGRAPIVHLKDFVGEKGKKESGKSPDFDFRPIGMGVQDIPAILAASQSAGTEWLVVEMDKPCCDKTSLECAKLSKAYLSTLGY